MIGPEERLPWGQTLVVGLQHVFAMFGAPVTLPSGEPLYTDGKVCYTPFMRATSCQIDQAGNVWVVNNWKPASPPTSTPRAATPAVTAS